MPSIPLLKLNPAAKVRRERITDKDHAVVIDDFLLNADALVEYAATHTSEFASPNAGFPGVQIRANDDAMAEVFRFVRSFLSREYGFMRGGIGMRSWLSLVTAPPEKLTFMQRICHIDPSSDHGRGKYAACLYLFKDERLGGTSFYRWRNEELVQQGAKLLSEDPPAGEAFMREHFAETFGGPAKYMTGSNDVAELIHTVPARYNRFVFFSDDLPHGASIAHPERLDEYPRKGRLSLNLLFSVLPKDGAD